MTGRVIQTTVSGVVVQGVIVELERFYINVEITRPFVNWRNGLIKSGYAKFPSPKNDFRRHYKNTGSSLLIEMYKMIEVLDNDFDRISSLYDRLLNEVEALSNIQDDEIERRIEYKLYDWFFDNIFTSSVSGIIPSIDDQEKIIEIMNEYKKTGRKIYLPKSDIVSGWF